jgi:hypothetical protein
MQAHKGQEIFMIKYLPVTIVAALALTACNNNAADTDAAESAPMDNNGGVTGSDNMTNNASSSSGASDDEFVSACLSASNQSESMCRCLSEKADEDLSDSSREFLIATLNEQTEEVMEMRARMSLEEMSTAGMFLVNASTQCASEGRQ